MTVTLQRNEAITPITIITTYAPRKGYTATDREKHWGKADQTLQEIPKRHMAIWRTYANGQLGRNNQDKDSTHIIEPYTYRKETGKGKWTTPIQSMQRKQPHTNEHMEKTKATQTRKRTSKQKHTNRRTQKTDDRANKTKNDHMGKHKQQNKKANRLRNGKPTF